MKFKNVKPGDIIRVKLEKSKKDQNNQIFNDEQWKVVKIYNHVVLTHSVKIPEIRRCFSYGDLVVLGIESKYVSE